jgi:hypothetical protein
VREYTSSLVPVNAQVYQDSLRLKSHFEPHVEVALNYQERRELALKLKDLDRYSKRPVVVQLGALARVRNGKLHVLAADANLDSVDDAWLPFSDVLERMRSCPAQGKLLILDLRGTSSAQLGLFADDVPAHVQAELGAHPQLPFLVLAACSAGQASLVSEGLGQSLFAYYLDRGLRGPADGHGPRGKVDGRITVSELADYVTQHVDRCAWETRGLRQTPVLAGQGGDFPLIQLHGDAAPEADKERRPEAFPEWLRSGWALRDKWHKDADVSRLALGIVRNLEAILLRAEQGWRGGMEEEGQAGKGEPRLKRDWLTARQALERQVERVVKETRRPSTALVPAAEHKKSVQTLVAAVGGLLPRAGLKFDDKGKKEEFDKELKGLEALLHQEPAAAAAALVEAAVRLPRATAQAVLVHDLIKNLPLEKRFARADFVERVQALALRVKKHGWDWPVTEMQQALHALHEADEVLGLLAQEPAALPAVLESASQGDERRRTGERSLFDGQPSEWKDAERDLKAAESLHARVKLRVQELRDARHTRDQVLAFLPAVAPILLAEPRDNPATKAAWERTVAATLKLLDVLARPKLAGSGRPEGNEALVGLRDLEASLDAAVKRCLALGKEATGAHYLEIQALLEGAWLDGPRREALWAAGTKLEQRLLHKVQELDAAEIPGKPARFNLPETDRRGERARQKQLRFRLTIDMIHLGGSPTSPLLRKKLVAVLNQADTSAWLEDEVSGVWARQPVEVFKGEPDFARADRLGRVVSLFEATKGFDQEHWSHNPSLALYRRDAAALGQWLGKRNQADGAGP